VDALIERLKQAVPDAHIIESQLLTDYDSYYYSQDEQRPLPILDFSFWYRNRTVWEVGMIILNLGGAAVSGIGLWIGLKRLGR